MSDVSHGVLEEQTYHNNSHGSHHDTVEEVDTIPLVDISREEADMILLSNNCAGEQKVGGGERGVGGGEQE